MTVRVGAVVEGHGEVRALPILIRRICEAHEVFDLHVEHPYRLPRKVILGVSQVISGGRYGDGPLPWGIMGVKDISP